MKFPVPYFLRCPAIYLLLPPPQEERPVQFPGPAASPHFRRLSTWPMARWIHTHLKCETFSMLEELPWQTVSVRLSDKLQGQKQRHIRFQRFDLNHHTETQSNGCLEPNLDPPRAASPVISREMYPSKTVPSHFPHPICVVLNKDQLQLCNMLAKISETLEPIYSI